MHKVIVSKISVFIWGIALASVTFIALTSRVQAATINVAAGTDTVANDSSCRLTEAIDNINDQAQTHADCPAGNGNSDTINLPNGTITLSDDLPVLTKSVKILGQGKTKSTINGGGQFDLFKVSDEIALTIDGIKMTAYKGAAIFTINANVTAKNLDLSGEGGEPGAVFIDPGTTIFGGVAASTTNDSSEATLKINNVYVHDFTGSAAVVGGVMAQATRGKVTASIKNVTVAHLRSNANSTSQAVGVGVGASFSSENATAEGTLENITIDDMTAPNGANLVGLSVSAMPATGLSKATATVRNATIQGVVAQTSSVNVAAGVGVYGGAGNSATSQVALTAQNLIVVDNKYNNTSRDCKLSNLNSVLGTSGTVTTTLTSAGGNIVDDNTCASRFNQESDKNNQTDLKDTLNSLTDNGGSVLTILPKAGSVVIDAGVCKNAPTTDARGLTRPQGKSCDSGAVEVRQASLAAQSGLTSANNTSKIYIDPPVEGAVISAATLAKVGESNDATYTYPYGMVGFTIAGVPSGSTQTINLYFESTSDANQFVARKYVTSTGKYIDVPNAELTNTTHNGKSVVKLSYQVQDGGELDADGQANGSITDPVGLAVPSGILVNTGVPAIIISVVGAILVLGTALTYIDYRKHKAPLIEADKELHKDFAKKYTFWHHLKVVTIPTARYKFTIRLEKKVEIEA